VGGKRYIVCLNTKQARKEAWDRQAVLQDLKEKLRSNPKALVGNKGYLKYLKLDREFLTIDEIRVEEKAWFDGKWVLQTNTDLPAAKVALKYKKLWQVDQVFRDMKSIIETRPIFHQKMKRSGVTCFAAFCLWY
jgi:hypothetical protein